MSRYIIHHAGRFAEWSTVVDAAVTDPMDRDAFVAHYATRYGTDGVAELPTRLQRAIEKGSSAYGDDEDFESAVLCNRMGPNESSLSAQEIRDWMTALADPQPENPK